MSSSYSHKKLDSRILDPRPVLADISILIPTLGREIIEECFYWIAGASHWPGELVVVDQGNNPQVKAWLDLLDEIGLHTQYIPSALRGRATGINQGLANVRTRFVAITDDDCFVDENWLETMHGRLQAHPDRIATGRVDPAGNETFSVVTTEAASVAFRPRLKFDSMSGGNMAVAMDVLHRIGFFDDDQVLRTAEDAEFAYRALSSGVPIGYFPDAVVRHFGWRDEEGQVERLKDHALSHGGFYGKYLRKGDGFILLRAVVHQLRAFRWWLMGLLLRDRERRLIGTAYFKGLIPGIVTGIKKGVEKLPGG